MKRIEILREANKLLKNHESPGLCTAIVRACRNNGIFITNNIISNYFPLFTLENAKRFGAKDNTYWWTINRYGLFSGRRRFMRWLMKQYRNDKEEII